ncbi:MAG: TIGR00296 family protein [Candidatus Bathyarchaeota archaeon]|nr:MAG: TIGR00296 family protein [Candidatus Bathyarchaeota archaeon]
MHGGTSLAFQVTDNEGRFLVRLARAAVDRYLRVQKTIQIPEDTPAKLLKRFGVFVTISKLRNTEKELKGCIGYPYPTTELTQGVIECAISAATQDPRFPPLSMDELGETVFEVSVLTPPEQMKARNSRDLPSQIRVGVDGLIVESGMYKGLLLPQVPVEYGWDEEEFLSQCCLKAGLAPDNWLLKATKVSRFQAIVFCEKTPGGEVGRRRLSGS